MNGTGIRGEKALSRKRVIQRLMAVSALLLGVYLVLMGAGFLFSAHLLSVLTPAQVSQVCQFSLPVALFSVLVFMVLLPYSVRAGKAASLWQSDGASAACSSSSSRPAGISEKRDFSAELARLEAMQSVPVGIMVCRVTDGEAVGRKHGMPYLDTLLFAAGEIFSGAFRDTDLISRISPFVYAAVLPSCTVDSMESAKNRIRFNLARFLSTNPNTPLKITIAYSVKEMRVTRLQDVLDEAIARLDNTAPALSAGGRMGIHNVLDFMEQKSPLLRQHAERTEAIAEALAKHLNLSPRGVADVRLLARVHDIGKMALSERLCQESGVFPKSSLSEEEREQVGKHPELGRNLLSGFLSLGVVEDWVSRHHERWDGEGASPRPCGEEIPLECRLVAIASCCEHLTSGPGKLLPGDLVTRLRTMAGKELDPTMTERFIDLLGKPEGKALLYG